jgi:hypothetical protein
MNKRAVLKKIIAKLTGELEVYFRAAEYARAEATHEQNKAENKYDTRGLEASYLARGQSKQAAERIFISSARAPAAPRSSTTGRKSSSSPCNRHWANSSPAKKPATRCS